MSEADQNLILTADDDSFEVQVTKAALPVIVEFSAGWCSVCKAMQPTMDAIAETYQGRLQIVKIDADQSENLVDRFGITALPTLIFFKGGEETGRLPAIPSRAKLIEAVEAFLA